MRVWATDTSVTCILYGILCKRYNPPCALVTKNLSLSLSFPFDFLFLLICVVCLYVLCYLYLSLLFLYTFSIWFPPPAFPPFRGRHQHQAIGLLMMAVSCTCAFYHFIYSHNWILLRWFPSYYTLNIYTDYCNSHCYLVLNSNIVLIDGIIITLLCIANCYINLHKFRNQIKSKPHSA